MFDYLTNTVKMSHEVITSRLKPGGVAVDATAGNGNDTLLLARLVGSNGKVYSFDIQKQAIENTAELIGRENLSGIVSLIHSGHENMKEFVREKVDIILFNLGYLPGGNRSVVTSAESTVKAVKYGLQLLKPKGLMCIVVYTGHNGGPEERETLESYLKELDKRNFCVAKLAFLNRINAPYLILVEKSSGGSDS